MKLYVQLGDYRATGEVCPECSQPSMYSLLMLLNNQPRFAWVCGVCGFRPKKGGD